jgi:hypothetical protein
MNERARFEFKRKRIILQFWLIKINVLIYQNKTL